MMKVKIQRLTDDATIPSYHTTLSAGVDLHSSVDYILKKNEITIIPTGIAVAIPQGYEAQVRPRSGLALKHGILIPNSPGTIDADYRGEIKVIMMNLGKEEFVISKGDRVAQMVFTKFEPVELIETDKLDGTGRGSGGFGSTGIEKA